MKAIEGTLIEGRLGRFISDSYYKIETAGFEDFTAEAHLYAFLEWSRYIRPDYSDTDRLKYLYEKCWDYDKHHSKRYPKFSIVDTPYGRAVEVKEEDTNPF